MIKKCKSCKLELDVDSFTKKTAGSQGLAGSCRKCRGIQRKKWNSRNRDKVKEYERVYRKDKAELRQKSQRASHLKRTYGITVDTYNEMLESQNNSCAICLREQSAFKKRLAVDHNHKTGRIRGLLCFFCNKFRVGKHTVETAKSVYEYLVKYDKIS